MKDRKPKNKAASVRQRILNLSRKSGEDFQLLLTRYGIERLLYRLSRSPLGSRFLLKGAMLFALWTGKMHRPTRDLDLLGFGDSGEAAVLSVFHEVCAMSDDEDGLQFQPDTVKVDPIREEQEYGGQRVRMEVRLGNARIDLQIDIGFGDAVTPAPEVVTYPTLLGMPPLELRAYPRETVVAEKLQAMVLLGMANCRMKDFYDLYIMAQTFSFEGPVLRDAIAATFARRRTAIPADMPAALTDQFTKDEAKKRQWAAFLNRSGLATNDQELTKTVEKLAEFLLPPMNAARTSDGFLTSWNPGSGWSSG